MSEMIERVAEAIYKEAYADRTPWKSPEWSELNPHHQSEWRGHARAAIEAMRGPTIKMSHAFNYQNECHYCRSHSDIWNRMIDEALK